MTALKLPQHFYATGFSDPAAEHHKLAVTMSDKLSELKIMIRHRLFSDPLQHMTKFDRINLLYISNGEANDSL